MVLSNQIGLSKKIINVFLMLVMILSMTSISVFSYVPSAYATPPDSENTTTETGDDENKDGEGEEEEKDDETDTSATTTADAGSEYSFYTIASNMAGSLDWAYQDDSDKGSEYLEWINGGDQNIGFDVAGDFVAYVNKAAGIPIVGAVTSVISGNTQSRSYYTYAHLDQNSDSAVVTEMYAYVQYGHALNQLGLDTVAMGGDSYQALMGLLGGNILKLFYAICSFVNGIFGFAIEVMQTFNPFYWLTGAGGVSDWHGATPTGGAANGFMSGIVSKVSQWYGVLQDLGVFVVAVIFAFAFILALMAWSGGKQKAEGSKTVSGTVIQLVKRLCVIFLMVPLLGGCYTALLSQMKTSMTESSAADTIIKSTFVDVQSWVQEGSTGWGVTGPKLYGTDEIAVKWNVDDSGAGSVDWANTTTPSTIALNINNYNNVNVSEMLDRYGSNANLDSGVFETKWKSKTKEDMEKLKTESEFSTWNDKSTAVKALEDKWLYAPQRDNPTLGNSGTTYTASNTKMSILATYNYLNTEFGDSSIVTYSTNNSTSGLTIKYHKATSLLGGNVLGNAVYLANALVMMVCMAVIAVGYAFGMLFNILSRGVRSIIALPMAMLGSLRSAAKAFTLIIMMMLEILGTFVAYSIVLELFMGVNDMLKTPLQSFLTGASSTVNNLVGFDIAVIVPGVQSDWSTTFGNMFGGSVGGVFSSGIAYTMMLIAMIVSIIFNVWLTIKLLKMRNQVVKGMDGIVAGYIDKLFDIDPKNPVASQEASRQGAASRMASGVKGIAGAAAGAAIGGVGTAVGLKGAEVAGDVLKGAIGGDGENNDVVNAGGQVSDEDGTTAGQQGVENAGQQQPLLASADESLSGRSSSSTTTTTAGYESAESLSQVSSGQTRAVSPDDTSGVVSQTMQTEEAISDAESESRSAMVGAAGKHAEAVVHAGMAVAKRDPGEAVEAIKKEGEAGQKIQDAKQAKQRASQLSEQQVTPTVATSSGGGQSSSSGSGIQSSGKTQKVSTQPTQNVNVNNKVSQSTDSYNKLNTAYKNWTGPTKIDGVQYNNKSQLRKARSQAASQLKQATNNVPAKKPSTNKSSLSSIQTGAEKMTKGPKIN